MEWKDVGNWLYRNGSSLLGLAGAVATGNIPGGVAAVASMITEATGETDPTQALYKLQTDPATMLKLEEIAKANEANIRLHHREMVRLELEDGQKAHSEQQATIRSGDNAEDPYVRHTRPLMELAKAVWGKGEGASVELALVIGAPALAYIGFRSLFDKGGGIGLFTRKAK
jgi:hypothetical protein